MIIDRISGLTAIEAVHKLNANSMLARKEPQETNPPVLGETVESNWP
jgi:hypothetical protein